MRSVDFVAELEALIETRLAATRRHAAGGEPAALSIPVLLGLALKNELEASELAAAWLPDTPELDAKLALARQCGDEAKHYRWIEERLRALGTEPPAAAAERSPLYRQLLALGSTVERAAAGPFAREALAVVRNEVFADFCQQRGNLETAALYRDRIQPDERHHHELGRQLLVKYATDDAAQARARAAALATLDKADELQELMRLHEGLSRAPGC